ncbi:MAG: DUF134 domain-containing protein [Candidatus Cloacimonetes bacterium]|jgi:uncharacterized protein|nr:DUF134 domain-containing protein [Candidatus Cloacimonadota bacterium]
MPRSKKYRKVCCMPESTLFGTLSNVQEKRKVITITVEEYEAIRLIDLEGMTQEECAERMNVARTTIQRIYNDARKKIAEYLVMGYLLKIEGGAFKICEEDEKLNGCGKYCRQRDRKNASIAQV